MKVLYITVPSFFDLEISLIRELSKIVEVRVLMILQPEGKESSAFSINNLLPQCDIISANDYPGFEKFDNMINRNIWDVANNPDSSIKHSIQLVCKITKYIKGGEFDIIHSTTNCKTALTLLPYIFTKRNTLYSTHDPIPHVKKGFVGRLVKETIVYKSYRNLLFMSDVLTEEFKKVNGNKYSIYYSRFGVYDFLLNYSITENLYGDYILFFGRIHPYKGVDKLISAFKKTNSHDCGKKLVIAGKGEIFEEIDESIVLLNRYISNEELANLIYHCKYVVLPYLSATQSGCVMSAFAFDKPVLATNVGDLPKEVEHIKTGYIVEPDDEMQLMSAIDKMYNLDLLQFSNAIHAKYNNQSPISWKSISEGLVNTYNCIIKK